MLVDLFRKWTYFPYSGPLLTNWTKKGPFIVKSWQNSRPFICEGGSSELTKPPDFGPVYPSMT